MLAVQLLRLLRTSPRFAVLCAATTILTLASVGWSLHRKPRAWAPGEVPIAFWAWRNDAPSESDVRRAMQKTQAQTLFLRAGQIDFQDGTLLRIREAGGPLPRGIKVHLVYNATRALLTQLDHVAENSLASSLAETFTKDLERSREDHTTVTGLQVDIDVPTRLLPRYATTLHALRARLPQETQLSITGLPTWMESPSLSSVLDEVDFWIPQCYGSEIPERLDQLIPISSPQFVARAVTRARELNRPFYAGLAAYSYALLYSGDGTLITLRGDLNLSQAANDANLELIERRAFENTNEWRYLYRARSAGVIEGLAMSAGDFLVIDAPSPESLRLAARAVRENAGEKLLGVCVFRLPRESDATTLSSEQVAAALADQPPRADVSVAIVALPANEQQRPEVLNEALLTVVNNGTAGVLAGEGLTLNLAVPPGSSKQISLHGFHEVTTHCGSVPDDPAATASPCSERRANILRFKAAPLASGESAEARLVFSGSMPAALFAHLEVQSDDGQTHVLNQQLIVKSGARK
jgi:hypothetical protein